MGQAAVRSVNHGMQLFLAVKLAADTQSVSTPALPAIHTGAGNTGGVELQRNSYITSKQSSGTLQCLLI